MEIRARCPECGYEGDMLDIPREEPRQLITKSKRGPRPQPLKFTMKALIGYHRRYVEGETYEELGKEVGLSAGQMQREFNKAGLTSRKASHLHWKAIMAKRKARR